MSHSFTNLIYHIIFSTKNRRPIITRKREDRIYDYIGGTIRGLGGVALAINGVEDHVHILAKLRADRAVSAVLRALKANSSGWMHEVFPEMQDFSWQRGYGAFTVSESNIRVVANYIARQKEHHRKRSSRDEFVDFLRMNRIEYDDRDL
ncbi:MAG: IS200/IS605 family transposase [Acidobacteriota bacterium]|nr:MAG: IS200/IS605 family transposase [Acidobacteriota bacterium]